MPPRRVVHMATPTDPLPRRREALHVRVAHLMHGCTTLGPGKRSVVWVRGCAKRCPGCIAIPILEEGPHLPLSANELAARLLEQRDEEGVTFSGGEPFEQAEALADVASCVRKAGRGVMVYTGLSFEALEASPDAGVQSLLHQADLLVDGEFEAGQQADLLWRGSVNQRVHFLTERYVRWRDEVERPGVGVELRVTADGRLFWAGVPAPGFVGALRRSATSAGMTLTAHAGVWA